MTGSGEQGTHATGGTGGAGEEPGRDLRCDQVGCPDRTFSPTEVPEPDRGMTWSSFVRVHNVACRRIESALLRQHDLTLAGYDVLRVLAAEPNGRLRMSELAERVVLSRSGTSRVVDGLEGQGLVRRRSVDDDLRGYFAVLTEHGRVRFEAAEVTHGAAVDAHVLSCLDPHEQRSFGVVLGQIARTLAPGVDGLAAGRRGTRSGLEAAGADDLRA